MVTCIAFEVRMAEDQVSETLDAATGTDRLHFQNENGHIDSPVEAFSPTSVIYFKEALNSSNVRFPKTGVSSSPTKVKYEFHIERTKSKHKSKLSA